jgi:hypothetical protein
MMLDAHIPCVTQQQTPCCCLIWQRRFCSLHNYCEAWAPGLHRLRCTAVLCLTAAGYVLPALSADHSTYCCASARVTPTAVSSFTLRACPVALIALNDDQVLRELAVRQLHLLFGAKSHSESKPMFIKTVLQPYVQQPSWQPVSCNCLLGKAAYLHADDVSIQLGEPGCQRAIL